MEARLPRSELGSLLCAIAAAVAALAGGCRVRDDGAGRPADPLADRDAGAPVRVLYPAAPGSFVDLTRELAASVVHLAGTAPVTGGPASLLGGSEVDRALGSGFAVEVAGRLLVLTNDHLVVATPEIRAVLVDGTTLAARVVGRDEKLDLALIELETSPKLRPARLGASSRLQVGEWVLALGNPFGREVTASAGIVSALGELDREALVGNQRVPLRALLWTDAAIHAGNSGGPLVNMAGEVVGVATAAGERGPGVSFAVPIDQARQILPMLAEDGRVTRSWIGVKVLPLDPETARRLGLPGLRGALVSEVIAGGPAARAGLQRGDVILRYADRDVDHRTLPWLVSTAGLQPRQLTVWRSGAERILTFAPERMPE